MKKQECKKVKEEKAPQKKSCPPPFEPCKNPDEKDECKDLKKKEKGLVIEDEVIERPKPPKCPDPVDPCAIKSPEAKEMKEKEAPGAYTCKPDDSKEDKDNPCGTSE